MNGTPSKLIVTKKMAASTNLIHNVTNIARTRIHHLIESDNGSKAIKMPLSIMNSTNKFNDLLTNFSILSIRQNIREFMDTLRNKKYFFVYGSYGFAKENKQKRLTDSKTFRSKNYGEDSYFIRPDSLGVADGVGGWSKVPGANPLFYSMNLMHYSCENVINNLQKFEEEENDAKKIVSQKVLYESFQIVKKEAELKKIKGSTTACLAVLQKNILSISNLGDCGLILIRDGDVIFRTEEQQHCFNMPFQLGTNSADTVFDAKSFRIEVQFGDVIVMGSDGLFDNLFIEDIAHVVKKHIPYNLYNFKNRENSIIFYDNILKIDKHNIQELTKDIAQLAFDVSISIDKNKTTPYAFKKHSRNTRKGISGKKDDITVLVALITAPIE